MEVERTNVTQEWQPDGWAASFAAAWKEIVAHPRRTPTVLVMDHALAGMRQIAPVLSSQAYHVLRTHGSAQVYEHLAAQKVDLVILNPAAAGEGLECCRTIKSARKADSVPVLLVAESPEPESHLAAVKCGADDFLGQPVNPELLRLRVQSLIEQKFATDRMAQTETILFVLAQAVEMRDQTTGGHCERIAIFSLALGVMLGLSREQLLALHRGGYLHDIGKVALPDSILFKPGKLTDEEWVSMRTHTIRGEEICRPLQSFENVLPIIRSHHERWDGTGYPDGLSGEEIPLLARVLQLADIYDALTTLRPYKPALASDEALRIMEEETCRGWRDPELMSLFLQLQHESIRRSVTAMQKGAQDANAMRASLSNLQQSLSS